MDQWMAWLHHYNLGGWDKDLSGYIASALVLATFSMKSMRRLRVAAIASNLSFIFYSLVAGLPPILVLHSVLLPLNVFHLVQIELASAAQKRTNQNLVIQILGASN